MTEVGLGEVDDASVARSLAVGDLAVHDVTVLQVAHGDARAVGQVRRGAPSGEVRVPGREADAVAHRRLLLRGGRRTRSGRRGGGGERRGGRRRGGRRLTGIGRRGARGGGWGGRRRSGGRRRRTRSGRRGGGLVVAYRRGLLLGRAGLYDGGGHDRRRVPADQGARGGRLA